MPIIQLSQSKVTRVSQVDFDFLNQWKWHARNGRSCHYAARSVRESGKKKQVRMHRIIASRMGLDLTHMIDHIDGDGINNTRLNLRAATNAQNNQNTGKQRNNTSGYKGINWNKRLSKWHAQISCNNIKSHLGYFDTKEEAAEAYRKAAKKLHKEFARV